MMNRDDGAVINETFDYQTIVTKDTPKAERTKLGVGDVWLNQARCLKCGDVVRSKNRHDFRYCKCGNMHVDGGSWYIKRGAEDLSMIEEQSEFFADVKERHEKRTTTKALREVS